MIPKLNIAVKYYHAQMSWASVWVWVWLLQISKMKIFETIINGFQPLTIVAKLSLLDICDGPSYTFGPG